jgi:hypothetical protein
VLLGFVARPVLCQDLRPVYFLSNFVRYRIHKHWTPFKAVCREREHGNRTRKTHSLWHCESPSCRCVILASSPQKVVHHATFLFPTRARLISIPDPMSPCVSLHDMFSFFADTGKFRTESMDLRSILPIVVVQFLVLYVLAV